jgi:hypothetical protein
VKLLRAAFGLLIPLALQAQQPTARDTAVLPLGADTMRIQYLPLGTIDSPIGRLIPRDVPWPLGGAPGAELQSDVNLILGETNVPAGRYSLWLLVTSHGSTLIINRAVGDSASTYDRTRDQARVPLAMGAPRRVSGRLTVLLRPDRPMAPTIVTEFDRRHSQNVEIYRMRVETDDKPLATLLIEWDQLQWSVPVRSKGDIRDVRGHGGGAS